MRIAGAFAAGLLAANIAQAAQPSGYDRPAAERYIIESERQWVETSGGEQAAVVERIIADDFLGAHLNGKTYDKAAILALVKKGDDGFESSRLGPIKVRFYGDTAVVNGSEDWVRKAGEPRKGRFVWLDVWARRGGRWQMVAAQDLPDAP